nr:ribonuclease H-like domain, reverse transcriptase, RNA-dependent DNA polymerase [Tanacetum cinerariifolium]
MFTQHENKGKYFRVRGRGKHKFSQGRNHENFKEERKDEETSHRSYNKNNFKKSSYDTSKLRCYKCKKLGHIAPDLEPTLLMEILEDKEQEVSLHEKDVGYKETNMYSLWYLENGASNHMTGVREHFKELDEEVSGKVCNVCLIGKHSRAPFPKKAKARSTSPLDLVYGDLCGPITPPTPSRKKYIFLLVDDYSRYMWVYLLTRKDQACDTFKEYKNSIENELRTTLKMLRIDRGGEFTSSEFTQYCKENSISRVARIETDFEEVFAPVARMETVRLLLAIAANNKWEVHHLDVKSAFLHGDLKEEVCVTQPEGFIKRQDNGKVYRLIKSLYGLRQAPRAWNINLDNTLKSLNFKKCALEQAIYTKTSKDSTLLIGVYVDDLIITGTPKEKIDKFKTQMEEKFEMSDLGPTI